ncbi:MAG: 3-oxoacyl-ACP synthase [Candidatus Aminicenantes bacterium RBG_16_63_16]|nr:MAG: 3-oxoacyl-ACP synthase [Candidatus Aminicenantes bacterium RBG_16_63_16]
MPKSEPRRRVRIASTGFYAPERILTNADLEKMVDTTDEWIVTRTGMKERHIIAPDQATSDMVLIAGRRALENARLEPKDIDLIIVATVTPDTLFPATACWVQQGLGADHVAAFDIAAACSGFLYGMITAEALIAAGVVRRVLLAGAETLTRVTNWDDRNTCVLFGDAAGAAVLEASHDESGILSHFWKADGALGSMLVMPAGGSRLPASAETVEKKLHTLQMRGNEVFKHAVKRMSEASAEVLRRAGLGKDDISWLIPHQANIRIIEATGERLGVPKEKVYVNIHKYGNVSAATIPIALSELDGEGKLEKGDVIIMTAFGSGLTWAAIAYRW